MTTFKSTAKDIVDLFCWVIFNPMIYIGLFPILFLLQAIFHNIPVEALVINGVLVAVSSVLWLFKLWKWTA
jgi:hypothetical protein